MATVQQIGVDRYNVRKPDRVKVLLTTNLRLSGQADLEIAVHNISNRGFMAEGPMGVPIGKEAMLLLPGIGWTLTTIRWSLGNRFGGRFADSINMRQFWRANPPSRLSYLHHPVLRA
jgi:hypothetical protein